MPVRIALARIGAGSRASIEYIGGVCALSATALLRMFTGRFPLGATIYQVQVLGVRSMSIAALTAASVGMVMALQFGYGFERFGAKVYIGQVVSLAIVRELGPVLTALMVGGRIGAGMAAELGSMRVTEQIDAISALGADPIRKLVIPRIVATLIILPLLVVMADVIGILGGMVISIVELDIGGSDYLNSVFDTVKLHDFGSGIFKTFFFAFGISSIACYQGFITSGGTEGVGQATTRTVVVSSVLVLVSDFFLTKLLLVL